MNKPNVRAYLSGGKSSIAFRSMFATFATVVTVILFSVSATFAQTKGDLGPTATQTVISMINQEIDRIEDQLPNQSPQQQQVDVSVIEGYSQVLVDFDAGMDLKIALVQSIVDNSYLTNTGVSASAFQTSQNAVSHIDREVLERRYKISELVIDDTTQQGLTTIFDIVRTLKNQ